MAHKALVNGTAYEISGGKTLVDGTAYEIGGGKTLVDGTAYEISFASKHLLKFPVILTTDGGSTFGSLARQWDGLKISVIEKSGNLKYSYNSEIHKTVQTVEILSTDKVILDFQPVRCYGDNGWSTCVVGVYHFNKSASSEKDMTELYYGADSSGSESGKGEHIGTYTLPTIQSDVSLAFDYKNGCLYLYVDMTIS